jgi:hypothetical protein
MIWVVRLAGVACGALGAETLGFLVFQRAGAALDLRGCADQWARSVFALDTLAMAAFAACAVLLAKVRAPDRS